jgi:L-fuconate dehydratase
VEYVDHLHQHFIEPVQILGGNYMAPRQPGSGAEMLESSLNEYSFPSGTYWKNEVNE